MVRAWCPLFQRCRRSPGCIEMNTIQKSMRLSNLREIVVIESTSPPEHSIPAPLRARSAAVLEEADADDRGREEHHSQEDGELEECLLQAATCTVGSLGSAEESPALSAYLQQNHGHK